LLSLLHLAKRRQHPTELRLLIRFGVGAIASGDDDADSGQERMLLHLMAASLMIDRESGAAEVRTQRSDLSGHVAMIPR
jgi:hypothetical protein